MNEHFGKIVEYHVKSWKTPLPLPVLRFSVGRNSGGDLAVGQKLFPHEWVNRSHYCNDLDRIVSSPIIANATRCGLERCLVWRLWAIKFLKTAKFCGVFANYQDLIRIDDFNQDCLARIL